MNRYEIEYEDNGGYAAPFHTRIKAYNIEHAVNKFFDAPDGEGWKLLRIARVREDVPRHRWNWQALNIDSGL